MINLLIFLFFLLLLVNMTWYHLGSSKLIGIYFQNYKKLLWCTHYVDSIPLLFLVLKKDYIANIATLSFSHKISVIVLNYKAILGIPIFFWKIYCQKTFFHKVIVSQYREKVYKTLEKRNSYSPNRYQQLLNHF